MTQPRQTRKECDKVFKQHTVELSPSSGKAATELAGELGIHAQRLSV